MASLPLLFSGGTGAPPVTQTLQLSEESPRILKRLGPSNLIVDQVPDFINRDHTTFRRFVEAYYEWMEQYQNAFGIIDAFTELTDVDQTIGLFTADFRNMYLRDFPAQLAIDSNGNRVDEANLQKNIRNFYGAKGTEKGYEFLFRLIYNVTSEVRYPSEDILKCSHGKWIERMSLKTTSSGGTANHDMAGQQVYQIDPITGNVSAYATVTEVIQYRKDYYDVTEIFIKNKFGDFSTDVALLCQTSTALRSETIYPIVSEITITNGGTNYVLSDVVEVVNSDEGVGFAAAIEIVNSAGKIQGIKLIDSGIAYDSGLELTILSNTGDGTASLSITIGAVTTYPGYYANNNGKLSSNKRLFDGDYYQEFSYALRSEISLVSYKEMYKKIVHPAGFKMFGEVLLKRHIVDELPFHSEMQRYEIPYIAHYSPYRIGTTADLANKYINGFNPHGNTFSTYQNYGQTGGKLLVTPVGFTFNGGITWDSIAASGSNGNLIVADIFEFQRMGATQGMFLLKTIDFDLLNVGSVTGGGFVSGSTLTLFDDAAVGYTATIHMIRYGVGVVPETTAGQTHDTQGAPLGSSLGWEGYIEAQGFSYAYWAVYHHPNIRGIFGLTGVWNGSTGAGASFGNVALKPFFKMPFGYHFHSDPMGGPYEGTTGDDNQYGLIESTSLTSPNF